VWSSWLARKNEDNESGAVAVFVALSMVVLAGMTAIVVDVGQAFWVKSELQTSADAGALAAASMLPDEAAALTRGEVIALANHAGLDPGAIDVVTGTWDPDTSTFQPGAPLPDAVRLTVRRTSATGNPVINSFAGILGKDTSDVEASAVALLAFTTLDFSGFNEGDTPNELLHGQGISGEYIPGMVKIRGTSNRNNSGACPVVEGEPHCEMIFDGPCTGGCSGGDADLYFPAQGNILIITEDGDADDPDDEGQGGSFWFDFSNLGPGSVSVRSMALLDIDEDVEAIVTLFDESMNVLDQTFLSGAGDGEAVDRFVSGVLGVVYMKVELPGSGAIDDIAYLRVVKIVE